jgi:hypothetical protein
MRSAKFFGVSFSFPEQGTDDRQGVIVDEEYGSGLNLE